MTSQATSSRDVEFLNNPEQWPHYPVCPVKRYLPGGGFPECGLLTAGDTHKITMLNLFFAPYSEDEVKQAQTYDYDSVEAMVADGWVVD